MFLQNQQLFFSLFLQLHKNRKTITYLQQCVNWRWRTPSKQSTCCSLFLLDEWKRSPHLSFTNIEVQSRWTSSLFATLCICFLVFSLQPPHLSSLFCTTWLGLVVSLNTPSYRNWKYQNCPCRNPRFFNEEQLQNPYLKSPGETTSFH